MKKRHIASIVFYVGLIWILEGLVIGVLGIGDTVALWSFFGGIVLFMVGLIGRRV